MRTYDLIFDFRVDLKEENYEENNNDDAQLIYREIIFVFILYFIFEQYPLDNLFYFPRP